MLNGPFEALERDPAIVYALNSGLRIVYCNAAWDQFAELNGGTSLIRPAPYGLCVLDACPDPLKSLYRSAFLNVFKTKRQWVHEYECSSARVYRLFRMTALRRPTDDFVVVSNFLLRERPHGGERPVMPPDPAAYEGHGGVVAMCCLCRRTRRKSGRGWDWVPAYVQTPPVHLANRLCEACESSVTDQKR